MYILVDMIMQWRLSYCIFFVTPRTLPRPDDVDVVEVGGVRRKVDHAYSVRGLKSLETSQSDTGCSAVSGVWWRQGIHRGIIAGVNFCKSHQCSRMLDENCQHEGTCSEMWFIWLSDETDGINLAARENRGESTVTQKLFCGAADAWLDQPVPTTPISLQFNKTRIFAVVRDSRYGC